ncbi:unnamed protein product [Periconia digitata]|uniref:Uncharacterized protein n=1 Tax=Periconia digitata TaxID=1303443 RepID=A0A9W4UKH1_9PLEO|nr:unnamed protein product [Periconia digitata]
MQKSVHMFYDIRKFSVYTKTLQIRTIILFRNVLFHSRILDINAVFFLDFPRINHTRIPSVESKFIKVHLCILFPANLGAGADKVNLGR